MTVLVFILLFIFSFRFRHSKHISCNHHSSFHSLICISLAIGTDERGCYCLWLPKPRLSINLLLDNSALGLCSQRPMAAAVPLLVPALYTQECAYPAHLAARAMAACDICSFYVAHAR